MIQTTDPQEIADYVLTHHAGRRKFNDWTLVLPITKDGYIVGIADRDLSGYTPTRLTVPISNYDLARDVVSKATKILFPDRTDKEDFLIEVSSMKRVK